MNLNLKNKVLEAFVTELNDEQRQAVLLGNKSSLILSTAGSGKTSTLTCRIAYLISEMGVNPDNILAVTFTNKAAGEMKQRLQRFSIEKIPPWIGTFHGICNKILRTYATKVGLKSDFYILNSNDQESLIKKLVKTSFSKDLDIPNIIYQINNWQEKGYRPKDIEQKTIVKDIFIEYEKLCLQNNCIDFSQLISRVYELLRDNPEIANNYRKRFPYILIDEFQDTNDLQYKWLGLISQHNTQATTTVVEEDSFDADNDDMFATSSTLDKNSGKSVVFAVGDDDQCLYSWRGARVQNMNEFIRDYQPEIIKLEKNYRSDGYILQGANAVIHNNTDRQPKQLVSTKDSVEKIRYYMANNDLGEGDFIAEKIMEYRRAGVKFSQMAILYRTNSQSRSIEKALTAHAIPFIVYGGFKFFDRAEVKNAMAYFRLAINPHDNLAFSRIYNTPSAGVGEASFDKLLKISQERGISLYDAIDDLEAKVKTKFDPLKEKIDKLVDLVKQGSNLGKKMTITIIHSGLEEFYKKDQKEGQQKLENLYELISAAQVFEKENINSKTMEQDFLALASLEPDPNSKKRDPMKDNIKIMTVHTSKGLEWDIVFVSGVEEGLIPHVSNVANQDTLEEERRLMYVAMTRAKKILYLSRAQERMLMGQTIITSPSRFLYEIPKTIITNKF